MTTVYNKAISYDSDYSPGDYGDKIILSDSNHDSTKVGLIVRKYGIPYKVVSKLICECEQKTDELIQSLSTAIDLYVKQEIENLADSKKGIRKKRIYNYTLPPYGYNLDKFGNLTPNRKEQAIIKMIINLREQGLGYGAIINKLAERGIKTKKGLNRWSCGILKDIVKRNS